MADKINITSKDIIALIAPHPDDECLGASFLLTQFANQTDVIIVSDGCFGNKKLPPKEEAVIRKNQFDEEMDIVCPRNAIWLGHTDGFLSSTDNMLAKIDLSVYTKIFMSWSESDHPDHRAVAHEILSRYDKENLSSELYSYEIAKPLSNVTHFADITDKVEEKKTLVNCHKDQVVKHRQDLTTLALNYFRAGYLHNIGRYYECFEKLR